MRKTARAPYNIGMENATGNIAGKAAGAADAALAAGPNAAPHILVVDDEAAITELVVQLLCAEELAAQGFTDAGAALAAFEAGGFDLAILDIMMPQMSGLELCTKIRAMSSIPIIFLSARDEETDQVVGLSLGADDYVTKPFKPRELVARVRAHLRRAKLSTGASVPQEAHSLKAGMLEMNLKAHTATLHDIELTLTPKEFDVLALLMQQAGSPVPVPEIFQAAWHEPFDDAAGNTVMVHIRHLRSKLAAVDSSREYIKTVWGVGYKLSCAESEA